MRSKRLVRFSPNTSKASHGTIIHFFSPNRKSPAQTGYDGARNLELKSLVSQGMQRILKGTVLRDFHLEVFFMNQFPSPQAPENTIRTVSNFFRKFAEIFAAQGAPTVSLTPVANGKKPEAKNLVTPSF